MSDGHVDLKATSGKRLSTRTPLKPLQGTTANRQIYMWTAPSASKRPSKTTKREDRRSSPPAVYSYKIVNQRLSHTAAFVPPRASAGPASPNIAYRFFRLGLPVGRSWLAVSLLLLKWPIVLHPVAVVPFLVAMKAALHDAFQQVHQQRQAPTGGQIRKPLHGRSQNQNSRALNTAASRMDIDRGEHGGRGGRGRGRGRGGRGGYGGRGGHGGRGGRGNSPQRGQSAGRGFSSRRGRNAGASRAPLDKDKLDMDLDNYMMTDSKAGRSILDNDLDSYMQNSA
ncbi:hypothetical protein PSACC_01176 [Paramicrosporidium saccamoebae]|uniref:Chromatin target of PRMT1 protein C-terminal domain-containing protein n=1 Tax=Paramicrosporidium saccamoebae TaxID=1246581 RepID=A0A2H9TMK4_9FUNG|nr:hypothetical protein PSACC_01176 [Paramicrosporidium saccamoebae]